MDFIPVVLGSDLGAYSYARSIHEEFGVRPLLIGTSSLWFTRYSKILDLEAHPDFDQPEVFRDTLVAKARQLRKTTQKPLLLVVNGDKYMELVSQHREELAQWFTFSIIDRNLCEELSNKDSFYEFCERHDIAYPKTYKFTHADVKAQKHLDLELPLPGVLKAADTVQWNVMKRFDTWEKVWIIKDRAQLGKLLNDTYAAGYAGVMVYQDFIPGGPEQMWTLNAYVDSTRRVKMMALGKIILADTDPETMGNYAAIRTDRNDALMAKIATVLENIGYVGPVNFDFKYDHRDQQLKALELNPRAGASSYFTAANGHPMLRYVVNDLIRHQYDCEPYTVCDSNKLWTKIDNKTLAAAVADSPDRQWVLNAIKNDNVVNVLRYDADLRMNLKRRLIVSRLEKLYRDQL